MINSHLQQNISIFTRWNLQMRYSWTVWNTFVKLFFQKGQLDFTQLFCLYLWISSFFVSQNPLVSGFLLLNPRQVSCLHPVSVFEVSFATQAHKKQTSQNIVDIIAELNTNFKRIRSYHTAYIYISKTLSKHQQTLSFFILCPSNSHPLVQNPSPYMYACVNVNIGWLGHVTKGH